MYIRSRVHSVLGPDSVDVDPNVKRHMVMIDPKDLIGRTFLKDAEDYGQQFRARVARAIVDRETERKKGHEYMKFIFEVPDSIIDEIFTCNEILDHIERDNNVLENDTEQLYKFRCIAAHQRPLHTSDKDWKGSKYNVLVDWETEETTYEPLNAIAADDPVSCAEYAKKNNLLNTDGWKQFWRIAKSEKKLQWMINLAKLKSYRRDPFANLVSLFLAIMLKQWR
jgi:hypothetical protein